ncbi:DUF2061 domain-containing protein [Thiosocius teredinicola]|uniref:DUF2061 domain-containing protein n=1 Tax=Thiosocius teredinicola TaxID=1973002 RepID=UPI000990A7D8
MLLFSKKIDAEVESTAATTADRPIRSLAKAISWRVTGSLDTIFLSWLFTSDIRVAAAIGLTEVITKMALYYGHERIWNRISLGRTVESATPVPIKVESKDALTPIRPVRDTAA